MRLVLRDLFAMERVTRGYRTTRDPGHTPTTKSCVRRTDTEIPNECHMPTHVRRLRADDHTIKDG